MEDADLRKLLMGYTERILRLQLDLVALKRTLFDKGLIAPFDLVEAVRIVQEESKKALSEIEAALTKPEKQN
jgi:hypothetical protein